MPRLQEVRDVASAYSDMWWNGALGGIHIRLVPGQLADGLYHDPSPRWPLGAIWLDADMDELEWRQVLLHEMIHAALAVADDPDEWERGVVEYHGPRFTRECNRIGRRLGLPDVTEDDSWAWPMVLFTPDLEPLFDD